MLDAGIKAPDFTLSDQDGNERSLSDFRGQKVVLYFYSKDMTSGCSKQAQGFAEVYPEITGQNAVVVGISRDSAERHARFIEKYSLPFTLLSDPDEKAIELYEAVRIQQRGKNAGKKIYIRTTYIIDEEGVILKSMGKVKPAENPGDVAEELKNL